MIPVNTHTGIVSDSESGAIKFTTIATNCKYSVRSNPMIRCTSVQNQLMAESKRSAHRRLQTINPYYLHGNKRSNRITSCSCATGCDDRESLQALETAQNSRLTAKETTATRSEANVCKWKGHQVLCKSPGTRQLEIASSSLLEPTCKRSKLKQPARSALACNQSIKTGCKDHLYRENSVMPSESLRACGRINIKGYKCTRKWTIE